MIKLAVLPLVVFISLIIFVLIIIAVMYNGLVRVKNCCNEAWSDIDTELKRRHDLIPNLVETVKGYAAHEKGILERVILIRSQAMASHDTPSSLAKDENALTASLHRVIALAENYPNLKANENFLELQRALSITEDRIQRSRRFYNGNVRDLSNRIEVFPSNIIAGLFGFQKREYFELDDVSDRTVPKMEF